MKKLFLILSFLIAASTVISQTLPPTPGTSPRSNASVVPEDYNLSVRANFYAPRFVDTISANTYKKIDTCGRVIFTYDVMSLWVRACSPKRWVMIGGPLTVDTSSTVLLSGQGTILSPLHATAIISPQSGNSIVSLPNGIFSQTTTQNGLISGGRVIWETGLTYTITAATYAINGVIYNSPETSVTLANADVTFGRIDGFVVTTSNTATTLTGTPSDDPQNPSFTPSTQLPLTFTLVTANETQPVFCRDSIYYPNNGQMWTGSVSNAGRINLTSTNNPYSVTQDIEFTLAQNNDQLRLTKATVVNLGTYSVLVVKIRSKATWASTSRLVLRWYNGLTPLGIDVVIGDGVFGFNSSITNAYQTIVIPLSTFGSVTSPDNILFTVSTISNNTIGLYADNIELLGCEGTPVPVSGAFWQVGGNIQATALVGGTRDNFPTQIVTNNVNHTQFVQGGALFLQGATPGFSTLTGTFAASDYYWRRSGTTIIENTAGDYSTRFTGNIVSSWDKNNNFIWRDSLATFRMQLTRAGNLLLGTNADNASTIFNVTSTTKASHPFPSMTTAQKNAISSPQTADLVYDASLANYYYWNGAAWVAFGATVTASNGLSKSTNDIQLGGTGSQLLGNTTITTSAFSLTIPSSNASNTLVVTNSNAGSAVSATSTGGIALFGTGNSSGYGVVGLSSTGTGIQAFANAGLPLEIVKNTATTNAVVLATQIIVQSTGTPAIGLGGSFDFRVGTATVNDRLANQFISRWTTITDATRVSEASITGVNAGVTATLFTLAGSGATRLNKYGIGTFTGTPTKSLSVDASGNIIETAIIGGGMTNPMTTTGDIIYSSDNSGTPARLAAGTAAFVLTSNGAGTPPSWQALAGSGTVTNVTWTGGIVSIATATSTPAFTVAGTSGGGVVFTSASTWASTGVLAANAIMIGGGAGAAYSTTTTGTGVLTALEVNVGSAGAFVTFNGAGGTPSSITLTNGISLPIVAGTTGTLTETRGGTNQTTYATGDMLYASGANTLSKRAIGTNGQVWTVVAGLPQWQTVSGTGTVTSVGASSTSLTITGSPITGSGTFVINLNGNALALQNVATTGFLVRSGASTIVTVATINAASEISGVLPASIGGTGFGSGYTAGQILWASSATTLTRGFLLGTANQINVASSAGGVTLSMAFNPTEQTLTDGATVTWNAANGANAQWTNSGTGRILNFSNLPSGYSLTLRHIQGSGGSHTVTTWTNVHWSNGTQPTLTTTAGATDVITLQIVSPTYIIGFYTPNVQ